MANGKGLDIFGCYLPAAGAYLRRQLMDKLCENMNSKAHNLVLGDFNFTNRAGDRYYFSTEGSSWATTADAENAHWDSNFQEICPQQHSQLPTQLLEMHLAAVTLSASL